MLARLLLTPTRLLLPGGLLTPTRLRSGIRAAGQLRAGRRLAGGRLAGGRLARRRLAPAGLHRRRGPGERLAPGLLRRGRRRPAAGLVAAGLVAEVLWWLVRLLGVPPVLARHRSVLTHLRPPPGARSLRLGRSQGTRARRILCSMPDQPPTPRWPAWVYGDGDEPDPRFSLANERTFLAWIRTGLAFVTAGLGIAALAHFAPETGRRFTIAAIVMLCCGVVCGFTGFGRWARNERAMRLGTPLAAPSALPVLSVILLLIAGLAAFSLVG